MSNVRRFDNVDDVLTVGPGAATLTGAYSIAIVVKFEGDDGGWNSPIGFISSGAAYRASIPRDTTNEYRIDHHQGSPSFRELDGTTFVVASSWHLFIVTQATGTSTPRFHYAKGSDTSVTHTDALGTLGHPLDASGGTIAFGAFAGGDPANMLIARAAVWDGTALSDATCNSLRAATLATWAGTTGITHLWEFNQASTATSVLDEIGNADQTALTGTAVVTTDDPPSNIISYGAGGNVDVTGVSAQATASGPIPGVSTLTRPYTLVTIS